MVKSRLCETARRRDGETSVFLCETETFEISEMRDRDFRVYKLRDRETFHLTPQATLSLCSLSITQDCETALRKKSRLRDLTLLKKRDFETALRKKSRLRDLKSAEKTRLRDPWNSAKILRDLDFLKDHSPPLLISESLIVIQSSKPVLTTIVSTEIIVKRGQW